MTDSEKVLTYDEAKQLCHMAFDGGADYGGACMQYHCNAVAYDWEHWLAKNARLFRPTPTVEDVLREFAREIDADAYGITDAKVAEFAAKLRLAGEGE